MEDNSKIVFVTRAEFEKIKEAIYKAVENVVLYGEYDINGGQKSNDSK